MLRWGACVKASLSRADLLRCQKRSVNVKFKLDWSDNFCHHHFFPKKFLKSKKTFLIDVWDADLSRKKVGRKIFRFSKSESPRYELNRFLESSCFVTYMWGFTVRGSVKDVMALKKAWRGRGRSKMVQICVTSFMSNLLRKVLLVTQFRGVKKAVRIKEKGAFLSIFSTEWFKIS